jgi:hypothetical protein
VKRLFSSAAKRLTSLSDIPYSLEIRPSRVSASTGEWGRSVVILAKVVGTDGFVHDGDHVVELGQLKVTKKSLVLRWTANLARPDEPQLFDSVARGFSVREVIVPRSSHSPTSRVRVRMIRDRMVRLLAPQHPDIVSSTDALRLCTDLHNLIVVKDVMES